MTTPDNYITPQKAFYRLLITVSIIAVTQGLIWLAGQASASDLIHGIGFFLALPALILTGFKQDGSIIFLIMFFVYGTLGYLVSIPISNRLTKAPHKR